MWQKVEKLAPLTGKNPVAKLKCKQFPFGKRSGKAGASQGMPGS
jgi:hypothetical protein